MSMRTAKTQQRYDDARKQGNTILLYDESGNASFDLSQAPWLHEYDHWVIISNDFPYDAFLQTHHLLIPKRRFAFIRDATDAERHEYYAIKKQLDHKSMYDSIMENFSHSRSAARHFHAHLMTWK